MLESMKVSQLNLGFIGFGHMAKVICRSIENARIIPRSQILFIQRDPGKMKRNEQEFGVTSSSLKTLVEKSDILLPAVRPNQMDLVMKDLVQAGFDGSKIIVSIAAGLKMAYYQKHLGVHVPVLRLMPNMPSSVGEGMSILSYNANVSKEDKSLTTLLFSCLGEYVEIEESLMDIASAIAGCGPAFVFRMIEAMARLGEQEGMSYEKSLKIAAQTFLGAGKMLLKGGDPSQLIQEIAVPGGMTEAGLKVMTTQNIDEHFQRAVLAAAKKSKQFSEEFS
jgi:pyrroline-5-carboxylate reductase